MKISQALENKNLFSIFIVFHTITAVADPKFTTSSRFVGVSAAAQLSGRVRSAERTGGGGGVRGPLLARTAGETEFPGARGAALSTAAAGM